MLLVCTFVHRLVEPCLLYQRLHVVPPLVVTIGVAIHVPNDLTGSLYQFRSVTVVVKGRFYEHAHKANTWFAHVLD